VSLRLEPAQLFMLPGPSGCGKTTPAAVVAGFVPAGRRGMIHFGDEDVTRLPATPRQRGHGVPELSRCATHDGVRETSPSAARAARAKKGEIAARVEGVGVDAPCRAAARGPFDQLSGASSSASRCRALVVGRAASAGRAPVNLNARLRHSMRDEIRRLCKEHGLHDLRHARSERRRWPSPTARRHDGRAALAGGRAGGDLTGGRASAPSPRSWVRRILLRGRVVGRRAGRGCASRRPAGVLVARRTGAHADAFAPAAAPRCGSRSGRGTAAAARGRAPTRCVAARSGRSTWRARRAHLPWARPTWRFPSQPRAGHPNGEPMPSTSIHGRRAAAARRRGPARGR